MVLAVPGNQGLEFSTDADAGMKIGVGTGMGMFSSAEGRMCEFARNLTLSGKPVRRFTSRSHVLQMKMKFSNIIFIFLPS